MQSTMAYPVRLSITGCELAVCPGRAVVAAGLCCVHWSCRHPPAFRATPSFPTPIISGNSLNGRAALAASVPNWPKNGN